MSYIYLDNEKQGVTIENYLLNKEVICLKEVSDTDFKTIIKEYKTILITKVEVELIRENTYYLGLTFKDFSGEENQIKFYIDGGEYSLGAFVKTTFYPIVYGCLK